MFKQLLLRTLSLIVLGLSLSSSSVTAEEVQLADLMDANHKFKSGFQRSAGCDAAFTSLRAVIEKSLTRPIGDFKRLSTIEKIREMHAVADAAYVEFGTVAKKEGLAELVDFLKNPKILSGLTYRLNFLGASSRKSLNENSRELLVIANKLLPFTAFAHALDSKARQGIAEFFEKVANSKSDSGDERVDHALRAFVFSNTAVVVVSRLTEARDPIQSLHDGTNLLTKAMKEDVKGYLMAAALESSVMFLHHTVAEFHAIPILKSVAIGQSLTHMVRSISEQLEIIVSEASETGEYARFHHYMGQIDELMKQPNLVGLPRLRDELTTLRAQFQRPSSARAN